MQAKHHEIVELTDADKMDELLSENDFNVVSFYTSNKDEGDADALFLGAKHSLDKLVADGTIQER